MTTTSVNTVNYDQFFAWAYSVLRPYAQQRENDWDQAQDLVQETIVQVWQRGAVPVCDAKMLFRQMRRVISAQREQQQTTGKALHTFEQEAAEKTACQEELLVACAFSNLSALHRQVLELRYIDQVSFNETARILGLKHKALADRLGAALRHLRQGLEEYCPPEMSC